MRTIGALLLAMFAMQITAVAGELNGKVLENGLGRSNVLVCVRGAVPIKEPMTDEIIWVIQNRKLAPRMMVVRQGQRLTFWNTDKALVTVMASVRNNPQRNNALLAGGRATFTFEAPERFALVHIDDGISDTGWLCVVEPEVAAYTLTDAKGSFAIPSLAPGKYAVEALSMKRQKSSQEVEIGSQPISLTFSFKPPGL